MTIPRRPDFDATWTKPEPGMTPERWQQMCRAHEHAVAVRAVEALKRCTACGDAAVRYHADEALREIDESGWQR